MSRGSRQRPRGVEGGDVLACRGRLVLDGDPRLSPFLEQAANQELRRGQDLPGRVFFTSKPADTADLAGEDGFPRREAAARAGLASVTLVELRRVLERWAGVRR